MAGFQLQPVQCHFEHAAANMTVEGSVHIPVRPQPPKKDGGTVPKWVIVVGIVVGILVLVIAITLIVYFATKSSSDDEVASTAATTPVPGEDF